MCVHVGQGFYFEKTSLVKNGPWARNKKKIVSKKLIDYCLRSGIIECHLGHRPDKRLITVSSSVELSTPRDGRQPEQRDHDGRGQH